MKLHFAVACLLIANVLGPAGAATLYRWTDNSGTVRYGFHPPPGMDAAPAEDVQRNLYDGPIDAVCRNLTKDHLRRIDREMERIKKMPAGLGPEYELTPAAKQELILDLLAHRAALLSGRKASEFRSPGGQEMERLKERHEEEKNRLQQALQSRDATIRIQQDKLERTRRKYEAARHYLDAPYPLEVPVIIERR